MFGNDLHVHLKGRKINDTPSVKGFPSNMELEDVKWKISRLCLQNNGI